MTPTIQTPGGFRLIRHDLDDEKVGPVLPCGGDDIIPNGNAGVFVGAFVFKLVGQPNRVVFLWQIDKKGLIHDHGSARPVGSCKKKGIFYMEKLGALILQIICRQTQDAGFPWPSANTAPQCRYGTHISVDNTARREGRRS